MQIIDDLYERFGRYLDPDINQPAHHPESFNKKYETYMGVCSRTGAYGLVYDHDKNAGGFYTTMARLAWMLTDQYQDTKNGKKKSRILQQLVMTDKSVMTTIPLLTKIPGLVFIDNTKDLVRAAIQHEKYIIIGFSQNSDRALGNGLRYSTGPHMEINGEIKIMGREYRNRTIDFATALRLSEMVSDFDAAIQYFVLRNKNYAFARNGDQEELDYQKIQELEASFGDNLAALMVTESRVPNSEFNIRIAKWLATPASE